MNEGTIEPKTKVYDANAFCCINECAEKKRISLFWEHVILIGLLDNKNKPTPENRAMQSQHALRIASSTWVCVTHKSNFRSYTSLLCTNFFLCVSLLLFLLSISFLYPSWQRIYLFDVCINSMLIKIAWDLLLSNQNSPSKHSFAINDNN